MMLLIAFWILCAAALGGLFMAVTDSAIAPLRVGHGVIAGIGLLCLLAGAFLQPGMLVWSAFALLAVGFAGGAVLFGLIWTNDAPPRLFVIGHGLINSLGLLILGVAAFS